MKKLLAFAMALSCYVSGVFAASTNYQDWWWNPAASGMGINIGQQEDTMFVTWYNYDDSGRASYLLMVGTVQKNVLQGSLYRTTGNPPGPNFNPANSQSSVVGTGVISFTGNSTANFTYSYEGKSGVIPLQRFTIAPVDISGPWLYAAIASDTGCTNPANNGTFYQTGYISTTKLSASSYVMTLANTNNSSCTFTVNTSQSGSLLTGPATFTCSYGTKGTASITKMRKIDNFFNMEYTAKVTSGETCTEHGFASGVQ